MSFDIENWVMCNQGECPDPTMLVPRVQAPRDAICFPCIEAMAKHINQSSGADRDASIADFRRRVMGLD